MNINEQATAFKKVETDCNYIYEYASVNRQLKELEKMKEKIKTKLITIMNENKTDMIQIGDNRMVRELKFQSRLDGDKIKELLGDEYDNYKKEVSYEQLVII